MNDVIFLAMFFLFEIMLFLIGFQLGTKYEKTEKNKEKETINRKIIPPKGGNGVIWYDLSQKK